MQTALQKNLLSQLKEKNMSINALEKISGLKQSAIQNIIRGRSKKPSADLLMAIAQALDCSVEDLLKSDHLHSPASSSIKKQWAPELYRDALKKVQSILDSKKIVSDKDHVLKTVEEVYLYSLEGNLPHADQRFAEWIVSRHFKT